MRYYKKTIAILSLVSCIIAPTLAHAENNKGDLSSVADTSIQTAVEKDFESYKGSLENTKKDFNVQNESFSQAHLENGIPYSIISSELETQFTGYVFPIVVAKKPAGIVFAEEIDGVWKVFSIKNNITFVQDLNDVKKIIKKNDSANLIYDQSYGLYGIEVISETEGNYILPMKDSKSLDLTKHNKLKFSDLKIKLQKIKDKAAANSGLIGGNGISQDTTVKTPVVPIVSGLVLLALAVVYFLNRRKFNKETMSV